MTDLMIMILAKAEAGGWWSRYPAAVFGTVGTVVGTLIGLLGGHWLSEVTRKRRLKRATLTKAAVALLLCSPLATIAEVKVTNEFNGEQLSHILECQDRTDIGISPLRGYLKINKGYMIDHLPISTIKTIKVSSFRTYIEFENKRMNNGAGWKATEIHVPADVMPAKEVLAMLDSIAARQTN